MNVHRGKIEWITDRFRIPSFIALYLSILPIMSLGADTNNAPAALVDEYNIICDRDDYAKALEWFQKDVDISEKVLGREHPDTARTYSNIAFAYYCQVEYAKALEWDLKALVSYEKIYGKEHPYTVATYHNIGLVYDKLDDYPKALEWFQQALVLSEKVLGKEHPDTIFMYSRLARMYEDRGDYAKALEWYQKSLAIHEKVYGKNYAWTKIAKRDVEVLESRQKN